MKLTSSSRYLSLLLHSFENQMMPELQSPGARTNGGLLLNSIKELLSREMHYQSALQDINAEGNQLVAELLASLDKNVAALPDSAAEMIAEPFAHFEHLNAEIAGLAAHLRHVGGNAPPSTTKLLRKAAEWECGAHNKLLVLGKVGPHENSDKNAEPLTCAAFQSYLRSTHPDGDKVEVIDFDRVIGGFGNQTWAVTVRDGSAEQHHWIIRKKDRVRIIEHKDYTLEREFHLVRAVNLTGFPAPKPLWLAHDAPGSDAPFYVMERLPGKPPGTFLGGGDKLPETLVLEWAALLANLHSIPLHALDQFILNFDSPEVLDESIEQNFRRNLSTWRDYVHATEHLPSPTLVYLLDWLERHIPKDIGRPVLTHGDFGIHNMLVNNGHVSAVLDWEASAFGSPALDLSYFKPVVEQHMNWQRFLDHYQQCGGRPVEPATLNYCKAYQAMKILVPVNRAVKLMQDGDLSEIRHTVFELGLSPHFMNMALSSTAEAIE